MLLLQSELSDPRSYWEDENGEAFSPKFDDRAEAMEWAMIRAWGLRMDGEGRVLAAPPEDMCSNSRRPE